MNDCIEWTGGNNCTGYGRQWINGRHQYPHRVAWEKANGRKIPEGMVVMHECDNRSCINPDHLRIGTHKENSEDMVRKGRSARGVRSGGAKTTQAVVDAIRVFLSRNGRGSQAFAARWFGLSVSQISNIKQGTQWRSNGLQDTRG